MKLINLKHLALIVLSMALFSCANDDDGISFSNEAQSETTVIKVEYSPFELEILDIVNEHRKSIGINTLKTLDKATYKADDHTKYMIEIGEVSHDNFASRYAYLVENANAKSVAENIAYGYATAQSVVNAWLASEGHKHNIENPGLTHFGLSTDSDNDGRYYYTHIFVKI